MIIITPQALVALFVVSTKDGWVEIMRQGVDAVGIDMQVLSFSSLTSLSF